MSRPPCICCGKKNDRDLRSISGLCSACSKPHFIEGMRAASRLAYAIRKGHLPRASGCTCTDCGKPANMHDHRDYTKPLEVDPVCGSCNQLRGPAFNSFYRPAAEAA